MQSYFGGQALAIVIGAIIPQFHSLPNTLPASAYITTQNLIGFLLYNLIFLTIILTVPPHKIRKCLYPAFIVISVTFIGILAWAISSAGGTGDLISSPVQISTSQRAFRMVQCISSIGGSWGGAADRISDWTRFERKRHASTSAMLLALPVFVTISATFGVLVTTATYKMYGVLLWNPLQLMQYIQTENYTPAVRAGTFFAGCGLTCVQIFMNLTQNAMTYGMDMAGLFPKYFSMKRGAVFLVFASIIIQPWRFTSQASMFITVLSCFTSKSFPPSISSSLVLIIAFLSLPCLANNHPHVRLLGPAQEEVGGPRSLHPRRHLLVQRWLESARRICLGRRNGAYDPRFYHELHRQHDRQRRREDLPDHILCRCPAGSDRVLGCKHDLAPSGLGKVGADSGCWWE
jgi:hypothetical protein